MCICVRAGKREIPEKAIKKSRFLARCVFVFFFLLRLVVWVEESACAAHFVAKHCLIPLCCVMEGVTSDFRSFRVSVVVLVPQIHTKGQYWMMHFQVFRSQLPQVIALFCVPSLKHFPATLEQAYARSPGGWGFASAQKKNRIFGQRTIVRIRAGAREDTLRSRLLPSKQ